MNCIYVIVIVYLSTKGVLVATPFYAPRFISGWYNARARDKNSALITIRHGLDQYPAKVDVQIKVHANGEDNIFTGVGSAQRDDDLNYEYGGIVYKYNTDHVLLSTPFENGGGMASNKSGIAYLGNPSFYTGPANISGLHLYGQVRVRAWSDSDMPELVFNSSVYMDVILNYKEVQHKLGYYPDIVTVQTLMVDEYMSDGQGTTSMLETDKQHSGLGGVVFGYDTNIISLWVPSPHKKDLNKKYVGIFYAKDGWMLGYKSGGRVLIKAWKLDCSQQVFYNRFKAGKHVTHNDTFVFPCIYNISEYLLTVQTRMITKSPVTKGMVFYGAGSTMATGQNGFGGVIYVYNDDKVMIWRPADSSASGDIINIGGRWGSGRASINESVAEVTIRVFRLLTQDRCPYPVNGNGTYIVQFDLRPGGYVKYFCNESLDLINGSLTRYCLLNQKWYGDLPVCVELPNSNTTKKSRTFETTRIDKKSTSKYKRTLISVWDDRRSVMYIGAVSILLVVLPLCICILPDIYIMCKHVICYTSIYQRGTPKNKASTSKVSAAVDGSKSKNNVELSYPKKNSESGHSMIFSCIKSDSQWKGNIQRRKHAVKMGDMYEY